MTAPRRSRHLGLPDASMRIPMQPGPNSSFCFAHGQWFDVADAIYTFTTEDGQFLGCPVCASHGGRANHLRNGEMLDTTKATAGTVAR